MNLRIVLFLLFLGLSFNMTAQDTLFLLGGKTIIARLAEAELDAPKIGTESQETAVITTK